MTNRLFFYVQLTPFILLSACLSYRTPDQLISKEEQEKKAHLEHSYEKHLEALRSKSEIPGTSSVADPWHVEQDGISFDFSVQPHEPLVKQPAELSVWIRKISSTAVSESTPIRGAKVTFSATMPHSPGHLHFPEERPAAESSQEHGRYDLKTQFGMSGMWEVSTSVEISDSKATELIFPVRVREK